MCVLYILFIVRPYLFVFFSRKTAQKVINVFKLIFFFRNNGPRKRSLNFDNVLTFTFDLLISCALKEQKFRSHSKGLDSLIGVTVYNLSLITI